MVTLGLVKAPVTSPVASGQGGNAAVGDNPTNPFADDDDKSESDNSDTTDESDDEGDGGNGGGGGDGGDDSGANTPGGRSDPGTVKTLTLPGGNASAKPPTSLQSSPVMSRKASSKANARADAPGVTMTLPPRARPTNPFAAAVSPEPANKSPDTPSYIDVAPPADASAISGVPPELVPRTAPPVPTSAKPKKKTNPFKKGGDE
jgi:hypothetical protein